MRSGLVMILAGTVAVAGCGSAKHASTTAPSVPSTTSTTKAAAPPTFTVALAAATHGPRVGKTKWFYTVTSTDANGKAVRGKLTVAVVDPLGTAHVAEVGTSTRKLRNFPFTGRYRDFMQFPPASRGYPLKVRVVVRAGAVSRAVTYTVTPR